MREGKAFLVGFNGSPRKYGNTYKALRVALLAAEEMGVETRIVHLYDLDIKPCIACLTEDPLACRYPCVIDDDMRSVYDLVLESQGFIVATPIYWYNVSGVVKNLIDRLTVFENMIHVEGRSWLEGKAAGVIAVGNDTGPIAVIQNLMAVLNSMGMHVPPWALAYHAGPGDVLDNESAVLDAANLGWIMARYALAQIRGEGVGQLGYDGGEEARARARDIARRVAEEARVNREKHSLLRLIESYRSRARAEGWRRASGKPF